MGGAKEPHPQLNPKDMLYLGFMGAPICRQTAATLASPEYLDLECCGGYCIINIDPKAEKLHPVRSSSFSSKLFSTVCLNELICAVVGVAFGPLEGSATSCK